MHIWHDMMMTSKKIHGLCGFKRTWLIDCSFYAISLISVMTTSPAKPNICTSFGNLSRAHRHTFSSRAWVRIRNFTARLLEHHIPFVCARDSFTLYSYTHSNGTTHNVVLFIWCMIKYDLISLINRDTSLFGVTNEPWVLRKSQ